MNRSQSIPEKGIVKDTIDLDHRIEILEMAIEALKEEKENGR